MSEPVEIEVEEQEHDCVPPGIYVLLSRERWKAAKELCEMWVNYKPYCDDPDCRPAQLARRALGGGEEHHGE
jgi:hypothetical protein